MCAFVTGIQRDRPEVRFGRDRAMRTYFNGFVDMINFFSVRKIIDNEEVVELCEHITNHYDVDGDFDRDSALCAHVLWTSVHIEYNLN